MIDTASKIVALVVATIGAGTTIYNIFFKGERGRKQAYYEYLLKPFVTAYKKNADMCAIEFVKSKVERDNDNIPKYVFHLIDLQTAPSVEMLTQSDEKKQLEGHSNGAAQENDETLRKVLIDDYLHLYSNEYNKKRNIFETVHKLLDYLMFLLLFLFVFYGALMMTNGILSSVSFLFTETGEHTNDWLWGVRDVLMGVVVSFAGLIPVKLSEWLSTDMYTVKKKRIQKMIDKKVRRYDRCIDDYVV